MNSRAKELANDVDKYQQPSDLDYIRRSHMMTLNRYHCTNANPARTVPSSASLTCPDSQPIHIWLQKLLAPTDLPRDTGASPSPWGEGRGEGERFSQLNIPAQHLESTPESLATFGEHTRPRVLFLAPSPETSYHAALRHFGDIPSTSLMIQGPPLPPKPAIAPILSLR